MEVPCGVADRRHGRLRRTTVILGVVVLLASSGCGRDGHRRTNSGCVDTPAPIPSVGVSGVRPVLERYLAQNASGWSIGDRRDGLVVTLPPGCDAVAAQIEARYGTAVH